MRELSRFEMAVVKRTAQNTKTLRVKRDKLVEKITKAQGELDDIVKAIEEFEAPIRTLTGGYSSEEVLAGVQADPVKQEEAQVEGKKEEEVVEEKGEEGDVVASEKTQEGSVVEEVPFKD